MIEAFLFAASAVFAAWAAVSLSILGQMARRARQVPDGVEPADLPGWRDDPRLARRVRIWLALTVALVVLAVGVVLLLRVV